MYAYEILECLEAVSEYEKGEGENIVQYENEFLLSNEDIKVLLKYIKNLQSKIDKINLFKLFLQERLLKHKDNVDRGINEFDERDECRDILDEFINFFKEEK